MSRRLIHEQKVGRLNQKFDQGQSRLFASAQNSDRFKNIVAAKQKRSQNRAGNLFGDWFRTVECAFQNSMPRIEHVDAVLQKIADANVVSKLANAMLQRQHTGKQFQ